MRNERRLVFGQQVQTTIEGIVSRQPVIGSEQIGHCAFVKPFPVQTPFAPWINEPVADQSLKDVIPSSPFAAGWQMLSPELVQSELLIEKAGQPASAPLPGAAQFQFVQADADDLVALGSSLLWKQRHRSGLLRTFFKNFDGLAPGRLLRGIDFSEIKHVTLHHLASAIDPPVFGQAPVAMLLAVFEPDSLFEKHSGI
ncbi:hypothetical protein SDC9_100540 [bioreactor metagenome]|uniref:Uncharacterized protein n=1 Tax=bioreactor metagenome TaxID=1076179 RepID=A0A645ANA8_9ZZZZ